MPVFGHEKAEVSGKVQVLGNQVVSPQFERALDDMRRYVDTVNCVTRYINHWSLTDAKWVPSLFSDFEIFRAPIFTHHSFNLIGRSPNGVEENMWCDFVSDGFSYSISCEGFDDVLEMGSWTLQTDVPIAYVARVLEEQMKQPFSYIFQNCEHKTTEVVQALLAYRPAHVEPPMQHVFTHMISRAAASPVLRESDQGTMQAHAPPVAAAMMQWRPQQQTFMLTPLPQFQPVSPLGFGTKTILSGSHVAYFAHDMPPAPWLTMRQQVHSYIGVVRPGGTHHATKAGGQLLPALCFSDYVVVTEAEIAQSTITVEEYLEMFQLPGEYVTGARCDPTLQLHVDLSAAWWALVCGAGLAEGLKKTCLESVPEQMLQHGLETPRQTTADSHIGTPLRAGSTAPRTPGSGRSRSGYGQSPSSAQLVAQSPLFDGQPGPRPKPLEKLTDRQRRRRLGKDVAQTPWRP